MERATKAARDPVSDKARKARARKRRIRKQNMRKYLILTIVAAVAFVVLMGVYWASVFQSGHEVGTQQELSDLYSGQSTSFFRGFFSLFGTADAENLTDPVDALLEPAMPDPSEMEIVDQFKQLREINKDTVGWVRYGDSINTPVVYRDNKYYLDHDFYGASSASGTVFADVKSAPWTDCPLTILYGHNMKNDTMFGTLGDYRALERFAAEPVVEYHSANQLEPTRYVPFALLDASMEKDDSAYFFLRRFTAFNEGDTEAIQAYLDEIVQRSYFDVPVDVSVDDRLLLLVTCSYDNPNGRLILFARALREGETAEAMAALVAQSTKK